MPKKNPPKPDETPQRERFIEKARELECDESGKTFERAFAKMVPPNKKKPTHEKSGSK